MTSLLLTLAVFFSGTTFQGTTTPSPSEECATFPSPSEECAAFPSPSQQESQTVLEREALEFAGAWGRKDTAVLREAMAPKGIRLHLPGEDHHVIRPRQAQAALQAFLERYSQSEAQVVRVSMTGAGPEKGFAELRWTTGSPGITGPVIFTLFVAFAFENESWMVTEIRVLL